MAHQRKVLLIILLFISGFCYAQLPERQLQIGVGYLMNTKEYSDFYLNPIAFKASLLWGKRDEKKISKWFGPAVGYYNLKPVSDTLYYDIDSYLVLTDRNVIQIGGKMKWDWSIQKMIMFSLGTDIGFIWELYSYVDRYPGVESHVGINTTGFHLAPFGGFDFYISESFGLGLFGQYELSVQSEDIGGVFRKALLMGGKINLIF